jgi:hypothetical protein
MSCLSDKFFLLVSYSIITIVLYSGSGYINQDICVPVVFSNPVFIQVTIQMRRRKWVTKEKKTKENEKLRKRPG